MSVSESLSPITPEDHGNAGPTRPPASARRTFRRIVLHPTGGPAILWLLLVTIAYACASLIAPYTPNGEDFTAILSGPTHAHLLGTDELGRDILSRLLYGGRVSLEGVVEALVVAGVLGLCFGVIAGYRGKLFDTISSRIVEIAMSIPAIVVLLMVFALFNNSETWAMVTLGILTSPVIFRVTRAATLAVREDAYLASARITGVSELQIMRRHVAPRIVGPFVVNLSVLAGVVLGIQAGLNYIGLGVTPPAPSWGGMVADAQGYLQEQPWLIVPSGVVIALTILAFVLLGDDIRDVLSLRTSDRSGRGFTSVDQPPIPTSTEIRSASSTPLLSVRGLSVAFGPKRGSATRVVQDVAFDIAPGEIVGIVGESGCGKTVTALALLGLLGRGGRVVEGSCLFEGRELFGTSEKVWHSVRGREIAFVSQEPMTSLDPCFSVHSQIGETVHRHEPTLSRSEVGERVDELLVQVGLSDTRDVGRRYPHQISGGMAQRICIAVALAGRPKLLVADEPTTALDVTVQAEILNLLRRISEETGMAVLIITHDLGVVADLCRRAIVMYAGEVAEIGSVNEIMTTPAHPYTQALLAANPIFATDGEALPSIPGTVTPPAEWPVGCHFADRCAFQIEACLTAPIPLLEVDTNHYCRCPYGPRISIEIGRR